MSTPHSKGLQVTKEEEPEVNDYSNTIGNRKMNTPYLEIHR